MAYSENEGLEAELGCVTGILDHGGTNKAWIHRDNLQSEGFMATCGLGLMNQPIKPMGATKGMITPARAIQPKMRRRFWNSLMTPTIHAARITAISNEAVKEGMSTSRHAVERVPYPIRVVVS